MAIKSIFDTETFKGYRPAWEIRQKELARRKSYYNGSIYKTSIFAQKETLGVNAYGLYKYMRPMYLPLSRSVDIDCGLIPGDWAFPPDLPNTEALTIAKDTLFDMSKWNVEGVLFVHYGAQYGVSGLKVCDFTEGEYQDGESGEDGQETERQWVITSKRIELVPIDPMTFMLCKGGAMVIIVERRVGGDGNGYEYAEVITPDTISTYKDGIPFDYERNMAGGTMREMGDGAQESALASWPNEYGVVPVVECQHMKTGEKLGEATYQKAIPMLAELNGLASYLADIVKKHAEPQWAAFGVEPSEMTKSGNNIWYFPNAGSDAKPLVAQVDVSGILEFIREIRDQVKDSLPELAFDEMKKKDQIATATLEIQLMELVLKIKRCRPNYDQCLADGMKLAGHIAGILGIPELSILNDPELEFDQNRPILPMDKETMMKIETMEIELDTLKRGRNQQEGTTA